MKMRVKNLGFKQFIYLFIALFMSAVLFFSFTIEPEHPVKTVFPFGKR